MAHSLQGLKLASAEFVQTGPIYHKKTKAEQTVNVESSQYCFSDKRYFGFFAPCPPPGEGLRHYLVEKNEAGQIIGIHVTTITRHANELRAISYIEVKDHGKGLASPLEETFFEEMQALAKKENKPVVWETENKNLKILEAHRKAKDLAPEALAALEGEQVRWQHLYGEGGKYGVHDGKIVFSPAKPAE